MTTTTEVYANDATTTVTAGGQSPSPTDTAWTVASAAGFPVLIPGAGTQFHVADPAQPTELITVTATNGNAWTVIRGAEDTQKVAHAAGFTIWQVVSAADLTGLAGQRTSYDIVGYGGADPTGGVDAATAISNTIAAAVAAAGVGAARVTAPAGTFLINSGAGFTIATAGLVFTGASTSPNWINPTGGGTIFHLGSGFGGTSLFTIGPNADQVTLSGFAVTSYSPSSTVGITAAGTPGNAVDGLLLKNVFLSQVGGVTLQYVTRSVIEDVVAQATNTTTAALSCTNSTIVYFNRCNFAPVNTATYAWYFSGCETIVTTGCQGNNNPAYSLYLTATNDSTFTDFEANGGSAASVVITGCTDVRFASLYASGTSTPTYVSVINSSIIQLLGGWLNEATSSAVTIDGTGGASHDVTISGMLISTSTTNVAPVTITATNVYNITIAGNSIIGPSGSTAAWLADNSTSAARTGVYANNTITNLAGGVTQTTVSANVFVTGNAGPAVSNMLTAGSVPWTSPPTVSPSTQYLNAAGGWTVPPGTGGSATVFNVINYGATGLGTGHDDYLAIQNAINAASAVDGAVYFPATAHWYDISATIILSGGSALTLYGDGYRSVIKANGNFDIFHLTNLGGLTIQSLRFDSDVATATAGAALNLSGCANMFMIWVQSDNVWNGLSCVGTNTVTMFGCFFHAVNAGLVAGDGNTAGNAVHAYGSQFGGGGYGTILDSLAGSCSFVTCSFFGPLSLTTRNSLGKTSPNKGLTFFDSGSNWEAGTITPLEGDGGFNLNHCAGNVILEQCWNAGAGLSFGGTVNLNTLHIIGGEYGGRTQGFVNSINMQGASTNITISGAKIGGTAGSAYDNIVIGSAVDNVIITGNQFIGTCNYCINSAATGTGDGEIIISENDFTGVTSTAATPVNFPAASVASYNIHDNTSGLTTASFTDWINVVTQYGADPTGATPSTTAIQAAIAAAQTTGRTVYFPAGTYKISSSLLVGGGSPGAITICGDGWDSQIVLANGSNAYIFDFGTAAAPGGNTQYTPGLTIRDLYLNCNGTNQTTGGGGIYARGAVWCVFDHLWIEAPYNHGLRFYQDGTGNYGHHNTVTNCLFKDGKTVTGSGAGLAMRVEQADENLFSGCTFQDCGNTSAAQNGQVYDTSAGLSTYSACHFVGGATGAPFLKSDSSPGRIIFAGNQFDGSNAADSVLVQGSGHVFTGNQFLNVGQGMSSGQAAAIHLNGATGVTVEGNTFGASTAYAVAVLEDSSANSNYIGLNSYTGTWLNSKPVVLAGAATLAVASSIGLSPGGTTKFLRADGTWQTPSAGGGGDTLYAYGNTGSAPSLVLASGNVITATISASAVTFTFGTAPSAAYSFTLILNSGTTGGATVTWPSGTRWQDAIPPALSQTANFTDILVFTTTDTGTNWYGSLAGVHFA